MFGRMMNNYFYGKSGKGDYRKEDMPKTRWELFWVTFRTRASALCRLNLMYAVVWLPTMIVLMVGYMNLISGLIAQIQLTRQLQDGTLPQQQAAVTETAQTTSAENTQPVDQTSVQQDASSGENQNPYASLSMNDINAILSVKPADLFKGISSSTLLILIPCIAITGPFTAGVSYVTRNWARDEHAFVWMDFRDAIKSNWKQSLIISLITGFLPLVVYVCWNFYGQLSQTQGFMLIPQVLIVMIALIWSFSVTYMHPLIVQYELRMRDVFRNGLLLGIARLPLSIAFRLLHCVPVIICFLLCYFWHPMWGAIILFAYYLIFGFAFSRFITASYTNAVFERFINPKIEGAPVNRGLRQNDDDDEDDMQTDQSADSEDK